MNSPARLVAAEQASTPGERAPGGSLEIALVIGPKGFAALRDEWTALFERAANPQQVFQSHVFLDCWTRHYLDDRMTLSILTGHVGGRLVMVWPLVRRRHAGLDTVGFMGAPVAQFGDLL